ncbi:DUF4861 domain-containing protein [Polaribacter sp. BAL334]|uniref:DUF4861 family protein n=1 Tax=Polaribacter sp. BAL334 TaxID=1708178 RepID=UPI0018D236CF|nr:DUF4861 family protein [Polaribacter sp. BAL334]MBG7611611.1 DUF4861 domain-containing protein [Polaribacter sp. BAL334]
MKLASKISLLFLCVLFFNCKTKSEQVVTIKNTLDIPRSFETVEIGVSDIILSKDESVENIGVVDIQTNKELVSQLVDTNQDGISDLLLFQPEIEANTEKKYKLIQIDSGKRTKTIDYCYSRFVPERTDDYAWENNKVAFRTYGPTAQKMVENDVKGGTLSSGIDAWLKRVDYPIINKWYKKYLKDSNAYHKDTGEGLDNFHVGRSRGVGGVAYKKDSTFYTSKNFISYKTLTNGPLRTSFILNYEVWNANGTKIKESKKISLDYGNNLSKFEIALEGVDTISAGLTLHEKDGVVSYREGETWLNYWQPHADSELGTAIVASPVYFIESEKYETQAKDLSHAFSHLKVINGKTSYYAGFTWQKSGQFKNQNEWQEYLRAFAKKIEHPLQVQLLKS